jgi:hypothetical protein
VLPVKYELNLYMNRNNEPSLTTVFEHSCEGRFVIPIHRYTRNRMHSPRIKKFIYVM